MSSCLGVDTAVSGDGLDFPQSPSYIPARTDPTVYTNILDVFQESAHDTSLPTPMLSNTDNVNGLWDFHPEVEIEHKSDAPYPSDPDIKVSLLKGWTCNQPSRLLKEKFLEQAFSCQAIPYMVIVVVIILTFIFYKKYWKSDHCTKPTTKDKAIQPKTKEEHRRVIGFTPVGQEQIRDWKERQATRARPNNRISTVFGLDNAFTTRSLHIHAEFLNEAKRKMQNAILLDGKNWKEKDGDWCNIRDLARYSVGQILSQPEKKLRIVDLVRVITLKVSLRLLFNASDNAINSEGSMEHLILIGQRINDLWIRSKDKEKPLLEWSSELNYGIHDALIAVCDTDHSDEANKIDPLRPEANPMNWLLPAYETMWRVVLACVIELRFRNAENADIWCKTLGEYISDTSRENFKGTPTTPGVRGFCANDIVKETLRLYPPTRHVYRRFTEDGEDVIADIESCHRNNAQEAFGSDSLCFRPERWLEIRGHLGADKKDKDVKILEEELGFMPFTGFCPAGQSPTQAFGFKMIALLAGILCEGLDDSKEWVLEGKESYQDLTKPLPSNRAAFDKVYLIKRT